MDLISLAAAKNYTNKIAAGITAARVEGNSIILTLVDGSEAKCTLPAPKDGTNGLDGKDGISVIDLTIDNDGSLLCHMSDGSIIDAGKVPMTEVELTDYYTKEEINEIVKNNESGAIYNFEVTTELPELNYGVQEYYEVELNEKDILNLEEFVNAYAKEKSILNLSVDNVVLWTFSNLIPNIEMLDEINFSLILESRFVESITLNINGTFDGIKYTVTDAVLMIAMGDIDRINNRLEELENNSEGEDSFIHLDLIVDYASAGSNPLPINSTKNTSELEKLSNLVNEYIAKPKPILLSIFNEIGTVYKDHYNIVVTTFGTAITATAKSPSLKYTILNGYKVTPFTLSISGTWTDGVYTCTSASITYDNTKDLMGTTEFSTITGRKIFNTLPETNVKATSNNQFTNKQYVDDAIAAAITTVLEGEY